MKETKRKNLHTFQKLTSVWSPSTKSEKSCNKAQDSTTARYLKYDNVCVIFCSDILTVEIQPAEMTKSIFLLLKTLRILAYETRFSDDFASVRKSHLSPWCNMTSALNDVISNDVRENFMNECCS